MPLRTVQDGDGDPYLGQVPGVEDVEDLSNVILVAGESQVAINAPVDPAIRSGWQLQNQGSGDMLVNELGGPAEATVAGAGSVLLGPRQSIGTLAGCTFQVPLTQLQVSVSGVNVGDALLVRSW